MELEKKRGAGKMNGKDCSFEFKIFVIEQINNGQISLNFASKKYNTSTGSVTIFREVRSTIGARN
jgi:hypothetical protein